MGSRSIRNASEGRKFFPFAVLALPAVSFRPVRSASAVVIKVILLNLDRFLTLDVRFGRKGQIAQRADLVVVVRSATTVRPLDRTHGCLPAF